MKPKENNTTFKFFTFLLLILGVYGNTFAQNNIKWYVVAGGGVTDMRNFSAKMEDFGYAYSSENSPNVRYRFKSKPILSTNVGLGVSGPMTKHGTLEWDAQLNLRTAGFRIYVEHHKDLSAPFDPSDSGLPRLGETETFRSWSLHLPLSIAIRSFEAFGFSIGADLLYQLSANPAEPGTDKQHMSRLQSHLGSIPSYAYRHPLNIGAHVGVFVPISERMQIDAKVYTDVLTRLRFGYTQGANSSNDKVFREMGLSLNFRYKLDW